MFKTKPEDFYNHAVKTIAALPKTPDEAKVVFEKVKNIYTAEAKKATECIKVFQKAATGDASFNEINEAGKHAQALAVTARFATFMMIPGAIFMLPALKEFNLDLNSDDFIPASVKKEFDLQ